MLVGDASFAYATVAVWLTLFAFYGARVAMRGAVHADRVTAVGGNALVRREIMDATYWGLAPLIRVFVSAGITPNMLTWAAGATGLAAGASIAFGYFGLATLLATISMLGDILDGQVARATKTGSDKGELLDAAVDRYTEFFFLGGVALFVRGSDWQLALVLFALLASFMISYSTAKAEALKVKPPRGLMRRHERAFVLLIGSGLTSIFGAAIQARWPDLPAVTPEMFGCALVALIGNWSAVGRLVQIGRAL